MTALSNGQSGLLQGLRRIGDISHVQVTAAVLNTRIANRLYGWLNAAEIYQAALARSGLFVGFVLGAMGTVFYPRLTSVIHDCTGTKPLVHGDRGNLSFYPRVAGEMAAAPARRPRCGVCVRPLPPVQHNRHGMDGAPPDRLLPDAPAMVLGGVVALRDGVWGLRGLALRLHSGHRIMHWILRVPGMRHVVGV